MIAARASRIAQLLLATAALTLSVATAPAQQRIVVHTEQGTPVVASQLLIATGPAEEDPLSAGIAHLSARAVLRPIEAALDSLEAHVSVTSEKDAVGINLIAAPDVWAEASRRVIVAIFRDGADSVAIEMEKREIEAELIGRRNNPSDAAIRAADEAFFGASHPWGRSTVGDRVTVRDITVSQVREFLREHFTPARAFAAVVGPIEDAAAREHLLAHLPESGPVPTGLVQRRRSAPSPSRTEFNSVTTWVTVAYPFSAAADMESLRLLAWLATHELGFGPTRRSVYDMKATVTPRTSGGELRVTVVVPPGEADAWADRIVDVVDGLASSPRITEEWDELRRRYRGQRLLELASPEDRAFAAAQALYAAGDTASPIPRFDELSVERLTSAAGRLGEPVIVFLGPFQDEMD